MNRLLTSALVAFALGYGASCAGAKEKPLGKVMFIGDSITHGFGTPSYRWALHKILVDNEVKFEVIGVTEGNQSNGVEPGTDYRGVAFNNRHSAMSSERAYEVSGRKHTSQRLGASDIFDWLLLDKTYNGEFKIASSKEVPGTFIILLGTNDTLSDWGGKGGIGAHIDEARKNLIGNGKKSDMDIIIGAIRKANKKAKIYVLSIPTWGVELHDNHDREDFAAIQSYNKDLAAWCKKNKVQFVDINDGLVDVSCVDIPFSGIGGFFNAKDHLHPTRQGDLIMAGHVAKALGYPGRTAGLPRGAVSGTAETPLTVELNGKIGDGAANGWDSKPQVTVTFPAGGKQGKLTISESTINWGNTPLYCTDFSANTEPVRISYVAEGNEAGVDAGFYVWLGDRLVGEALQGAAGSAAFSADVGQTEVKVSTSAEALAPVASAPSPEKKKKKK